MEFSEKLMNKYKIKLKKTKTKLKKVQSELKPLNKNYKLAKKVVDNLERLKKMSDYEIRKKYLPRIYTSDCTKTLLEFFASKRDVIHYDISERFNSFNRWLVKKHDGIYDIENLGEMGSMSDRFLKEGKSKGEFDDSVWDTFRGWIRQYNQRQMKENLYNSIMNADFEFLYEELIRQKI